MEALQGRDLAAGGGDGRDRIQEGGSLAFQRVEDVEVAAGELSLVQPGDDQVGGGQLGRALAPQKFSQRPPHGQAQPAVTDQRAAVAALLRGAAEVLHGVEELLLGQGGA